MNLTGPQDRKPKSMIGQYAGFISRTVAFIIDIIVVSISLLATTWFVTTTINMFKVNALRESLTANFPVINTLINVIYSPITASLLSLGFILLYYVFFLSLAGQTPGKAVLGIRVVPLHGSKISIWRALFRYIGYYLSALPFGLGFFWVLLDDRRMAFHDKLAGTCVIYIWDARPDETFLKRAIDELVARSAAVRALVAKRKRIVPKLQDPDVSPPEDQSQQLQT